MAKRQIHVYHVKNPRTGEYNTIYVKDPIDIVAVKRRIKNTFYGTLITLLLGQGIANTQYLKEGEIKKETTVSTKPLWPKRFWDFLSDQSPGAIAEKKWGYEQHAKVKNLLPEGARFKIDRLVGRGGYSIWEKDSNLAPSDNPFVHGLDKSNIYFLYDNSENLDTYFFRYDDTIGPDIKISTLRWQPDSIKSVDLIYQDNTLDKFPGLDKFKRGHYSGETAEDSALFEMMRPHANEVYKLFNLEQIKKVLTDFQEPHPTYPRIPLEFTVINLPIIASERKNKLQEEVEKEIDKKTKDEMDKARGDFYFQYVEQFGKAKKTYRAPTSSLFATTKLVEQYKKQIQTQGYKEGLTDCIDRALKGLDHWGKRNLAKIIPEDSTFISLGSGDGKADEWILEACRDYKIEWKEINGFRYQETKTSRLKTYLSVENDASIGYAMDNINSLGIPAVGLIADIENDNKGLAKLLQIQPGPRVIATKDTDINFAWNKVIQMYTTISKNMNKGDVLIRSAPLEHEQMYNTYEGIADAATAYLQELGLNPEKWKFLGPQYDKEKQEWQTEFECLSRDEIEGNGTYTVFSPGDRFQHLTSRRKDLKEDIERLGLKLEIRISDPRGGYAIDFYVKG